MEGFPTGQLFPFCLPMRPRRLFRSRPFRHGGAPARPVVDLAGREAGEAGEAGLGDAGAGEEGVEFGVQERSHPLFHIEMSSIPEVIAPSLKRSRRDNPQFLAFLRLENPHFGPN